MNALLEHYTKKEDREEFRPPNPFDSVFGKQIAKKV